MMACLGASPRAAYYRVRRGMRRGGRIDQLHQTRGLGARTSIGIGRFGGCDPARRSASGLPRRSRGPDRLRRGRQRTSIHSSGMVHARTMGRVEQRTDGRTRRRSTSTSASSRSCSMSMHTSTQHIPSSPSSSASTVRPRSTPHSGRPTPHRQRSRSRSHVGERIPSSSVWRCQMRGRRPLLTRGSWRSHCTPADWKLAEPSLP